jgi:hypothetical protein
MPEIHNLMNKELEYIDSKKGREMLTVDGLRSIQESLEAGRTYGRPDSIEIGCNPARIHGRLGSGGTKEVYDVEIGNQRYAVSVPGACKDPERLTSLWWSSLGEPDVSRKFRELGLLVNNLSEVVRGRVNGIPFPLLIMGRYEDQELPVYDSKNSHGNRNPLVSEDTHITREGFLSLCKMPVEDVAVVVRNGIMIDGDSFNYAQSNEGDSNGIFFMDFGNAEFLQLTRAGRRDSAKLYAGSAIDAVMASFGRTYGKNKSLQALDRRETREEIQQTLTQRVLERV